MASPAAIGIMREQAMSRIENAVMTLCERFELDPAQFELDPFDRDPNLKHALQLEGVAAFLEALTVLPAPAEEGEEGEAEAQVGSEAKKPAKGSKQSTTQSQGQA